MLRSATQQNNNFFLCEMHAVRFVQQENVNDLQCKLQQEKIELCVCAQATYRMPPHSSNNNNNRNNVTAANTIEHQSNLFAIVECHKNQYDDGGDRMARD